MRHAVVILQAVHHEARIPGVQLTLLHGQLLHLRVVVQEVVHLPVLQVPVVVLVQGEYLHLLADAYPVEQLIDAVPE